MGKKQKNDTSAFVHYGRFVIAIFAILIAAAHLPYASISSGMNAPHQTSASASSQHVNSIPFGFQALGFWFDIETITYAVIAVVFLLGIRRWYAAATVFNGFNVVLYFLSGYTAIPGITSMAFGSRLNALTSSLPNAVMIISWIALLILSIIFLKYDRGSELEDELS